jgi:hypothetical protein
MLTMDAKWFQYLTMPFGPCDQQNQLAYLSTGFSQNESSLSLFFDNFISNIIHRFSICWYIQNKFWISK